MRRPGASTRSGSVLLQAFFVIFLGVALAALVVDLGLVRVTQGSMQVAADAAALEGLRLRDGDPDPAQADLIRRRAAADLAASVFDDDRDLSTPNATHRLGAGPVLDNGAVDSSNPAGGLLVGGAPWVPDLQTNAGGNSAPGDLVAGTFEALDPALPGNPDWHREDAAYARTDFAPAAPFESPDAPALLARLRRTHDPDGLDEIAGISSRGPSLPFLFGLGTAALTPVDPAAYDPRRDGLTVRATSIADARPAVAAGLAAPGLPGLAVLGTDAAAPAVARVLAFQELSWSADLIVGAAFDVRVRSDGRLEPTPGGPTLQVDGVAQPADGPVRVGAPAQTLPGVAGAVQFPADPAELLGERWVALYGAVAGGAPAVTGFAAVRIDQAQVVQDAATGELVLGLLGVKLASRVAPANASAVPGLALDVSALVPAAPQREPLLAAVLAR